MRIRAFLVALVVVGLAASAYVAVQRVRVESCNRAVELVVDYSDVSSIVSAAETPVGDVLRSLKQCGVTSLAVNEWTVKDLIDARSLGFHSRIDDRVLARTKEAVGDWGMSPQYVEQLPVDLPAEPLVAANAVGLKVIARLLNYPGAVPSSIEKRLTELKDTGIDTVIFQGDQVLGFKGAVEDTAEAFETNGLVFGRVEFAKQKGEQEIAVKAPGNVVIVHSITQNEMPGLSETAIADRFQKAVRERGVRICYVRMYYTASGDLLRANCDYIRRIARGIRAAGYELKPAHAMAEVVVPSWIRMLVAVGVAAGAILLVLAVIELPVGAAIAWTLAALIVCVGLAGTGDSGRKLVALGAALVFPTLAALWAVRGAPESPTSVPRPLLRAWGRMLGAIGISVAGGVLIVGLLSSREFMLRSNQFMGIKAAHLLPIVALAALFAGGIAWAAGTWPEQKRRLCESYQGIAASPILVGQAIGLVALLVLLALVVARSGNDAGLEVSSVELKFRAILDKIMFVRPRTKEFLIGYPLLLAGIAFVLRGRRQWGAILVVVGSLGLVSALNTFCHIHTPLAVTGLRVFNGVVVGSILGLILYRLIGRLPGSEAR